MCVIRLFVMMLRKSVDSRRVLNEISGAAAPTPLFKCFFVDRGPVVPQGAGGLLLGHRGRRGDIFEIEHFSERAEKNRLTAGVY